MASARFTRGVPRIAILGGGQLAKMMAQDARRMGFGLSVLDPDPQAPALPFADHAIAAAFGDIEALRRICSHVDVTTFDLEHVDVEALQPLAAAGIEFAPSLQTMAWIQDKLVQKQRLAQHGLPVPEFRAADGGDAQSLSALGFPVFQKVRKAGYDGYGVRRLASAAELSRALPGPSMIERPIAIECELGVLVARGKSGEVATYDPVEMVFDPEANRLDYVRAPGPIAHAHFAEARELALAAAEAVQAVGVLAVELFLDRDGKLWVNELAPRPHNSGHHTIEASLTSQFEQHLRAVAGLPLGSTQQILPAAMANLIGTGAHAGPTRVEGLRAALALPGVALHLYGKAQNRRGRKMGHVTALHRDIDEAVRLACAARDALTITSASPEEPSS
ncbi:MAG: 5-(carboxyamino)imidazole ribonucleotide synthase [Planctomycetes bacterium]|nr:5-(carboxyamino)imidazole ribonucleotide synthase [Planctomycetota bacterium]